MATDFVPENFTMQAQNRFDSSHLNAVIAGSLMTIQIDWCAILVSPICKVAFPWFMNEVKDLAKFDDAKYRVVADGQIRRRLVCILRHPDIFITSLT